jgi:1-acyl-sn-glycerol-3-phosphate acyltransferase
MKNKMNHFLMRVLNFFLWNGELVGKENLPRSGPAVFIANHLEAVGPIAAFCSIPFRLYAWTIADMVDEEKAAAWLKWDFVERTLELKPPVSAWVATLMSKITVPFLHWMGCIPVYRGRYDRLAETLQLSMDVLHKDKCLLIFPEDNRLQADPVTGMKPFQHSFGRLGEKYFAETGGRLEFYPVAIHGSGYIMVGKVVTFNPNLAVAAERQRLKRLMENAIKTMYMQMENEDSSNMLTPQQNQHPTGEFSR